MKRRLESLRDWLAYALTVGGARMLPPADARLDAVREQLRQVEKWGVQHHADGTGGRNARKNADAARIICDAEHEAGNGTWRSILLEEVYEALAERPNSGGLREELVQVAAVALSWVDDIDTRDDG